MTNEEVTRRQVEQEVKYLAYLIEKCEKEKLTNKQWFIDIEDTINALSVRDHNVNNIN